MESWLTSVVERLARAEPPFPAPFLPLPLRPLRPLLPLLLNVFVFVPLMDAFAAVAPPTPLSIKVCVSLISSSAWWLLTAPGVVLLLQALPLTRSWPEELPVLSEELLVPLDNELSEMRELGRRALFVTSNCMPAKEWRSLGALMRGRWGYCSYQFLSDLFLPLPSCDIVMERSLIWLLLGRMSRHGLLPIPIEDISARRISKKYMKMLFPNIDYNRLQC